MTNNVSVQLTFSSQIEGVTTSYGPKLVSATPSVDFDVPGQIQAIATTATAIAVGGITSMGYIMIVNLDAANYVEIDANNVFNGFPQKLLAGDMILLKPETATIYAKAHTSPVNVIVLAVSL